MEITDGLIDRHQLHSLRSWILGQPLIHGWRAHGNAPGTFWHRNFVLPGSHKHHYDPGAWHPDLTFAQLLSASTPLTDVAKTIQHRFFGDSDITRVWVNVQSFGDESAFHRDFPAEFTGTARSVILYPVDQWEINWGAIWLFWMKQARSRQPPWSSPEGSYRSTVASAMRFALSPVTAMPCGSHWYSGRRCRDD